MTSLSGHSGSQGFRPDYLELNFFVLLNQDLIL